METATSEAKPRDRILSAARRLFRKHGIRGVGVDAIAKIADTNKMTLYRHFGSKDALVVECLHQLVEEADKAWERLEVDYPEDAWSKLKAWLRQGSSLGGPDGRGCSLANAAIELAEENQPARELIARFKRDQRTRLAKLCRDLSISGADTLADTLLLMLEGARVSRQTMGSGGLASNFVTSAEAVIASFSVRPTSMGPNARSRS